MCIRDRFRDDLARAGNAGLQNAEDIVRINLKSLQDDAAKSGDNFFRVEPKKALAAARKGETIFNLGSQKALKLTNQSKVLRASKVPEMVEMADSIDKSLIRAARATVSKSNIKQSLKTLGADDKIASELSSELEKKVLKQSELKLLFDVKLSELAKSSKISEDLLGIYIAGNSIAAFTSAPFSNAIRASLNLFSLRKWAPVVADTVDPILTDFINATLRSPTVKNETVKQMLQTMLVDINGE